MADLNQATHGKLGAIYRQRKNNFKGAGLNDAAWGLAAANAASASYEVVIDSELGGTGGVDTFKWRKNGGAWTAGVDITGAAQALDEGQTIIFTATTGHTLTDQWSMGNLKDEACTESGTTAQITDAAKRLLNPDAPATFTDSGGAQVTWIDFASGTAHFSANVASVTVTGNDGFILESGLQKLGYLIDWNMTVSVALASKMAMGDDWESDVAAAGSGTGGSNAFFIGNQSLVKEILAAASGDMDHCLLQLFVYDPDQDQTGSHYITWASFQNINLAASVGELVKEGTSFKFEGKPGYVANA